MLITTTANLVLLATTIVPSQGATPPAIEEPLMVWLEELTPFPSYEIAVKQCAIYSRNKDVLESLPNYPNKIRDLTENGRRLKLWMLLRDAQDIKRTRYGRQCSLEELMYHLTPEDYELGRMPPIIVEVRYWNEDLVMTKIEEN